MTGEIFEPRTAAEILQSIEAQIETGRLRMGELSGVCGVVARYCLDNTGISLSSSDALLLVQAALRCAVTEESAVTNDPITEEWLKSVGFKWHQFDRQPEKHWLLWLGGGLKQRPSLTSYEDIGIELTAEVPPRDGSAPEWFCWFRSDGAGRYHRFIHVRHLTTTKDVIDLVQAISGRPWDPTNHLHGSLQSPENAARIRKDMERLDQRLMRDGHKWADIEKDDTRGRALPEHMQAAENARVKKP